MSAHFIYPGPRGTAIWQGLSDCSSSACFSPTDPWLWSHPGTSLIWPKMCSTPFTRGRDPGVRGEGIKLTP